MPRRLSRDIGNLHGRRFPLREVNQPDVAAQLLKQTFDFVLIIVGQKSHRSLSLVAVLAALSGIIAVVRRFGRRRSQSSPLD